MQITFLGTGAATAVPLPFCSCPTCRAARVQGGKDLRTRSALLINDDLLIDCGADAVSSAHRLGKDLTRVRTLLVTHAHGDHFDPGHLVTRMPEYGCADTPPLLIAASGASLTRLGKWLEGEESGTDLTTPSGREKLNLTVHEVQVGTPFSAGKYTIIGIYSHHAPDCDSRMYLISDGQTAIFYGVDSPAFGEDVWQALEHCRTQFACVILDHTYGLMPETGYPTDHMNARDVAEAAVRLRAQGLLMPRGHVFATHLSHENMLPHEEMSAFARAHGYEIAFDGLTLTL